MKDIRMMTDEELTGEFKATVESDHLRGGYTDETEACKLITIRRMFLP